MELIYCAGGNQRFAQIAVESGYLYGVQAPAKPHYPLHFCDQDWRKPEQARYISFLREHRPSVATVLDLEQPDQVPDVLAWAEDASPHVQSVVIIPKYSGAVDALPRTIGNATVRLGYSVPTRFGGTCVPTWEFAGWPVHLLGGAPHRQMILAQYLNVVSVDGNIAHKLAIRYGQFWVPGTAKHCRNHYWPKLSEVGDDTKKDGMYEAFRRSCINIRAAWVRRGYCSGEDLGRPA